MAVELLEKPVTQIQDGVTWHVYAVDAIEDLPHGGEPVAESALPKAVGYVALTPSQMARCIDDDPRPYMIHDTMVVQGVVAGEAIYNKTVSPRGFLGCPKPFYGARISFARKHAARRVVATLT